MNAYRTATTGLTLASVAFLAAPLQAQDEGFQSFPLGPLRPAGDIVAPFFDGWYANDDGTFTLSFGFFNRNLEEDVYIPHGPDNYIEPAEYDGMQPTWFPAYNRPGFVGKRERGAFAITVPPEMEGEDVVWTITHAGSTYSVPGRTTSAAYELSHAPAAAGSLAPALTFDPDGEGVYGREGIIAEPVSTSVGAPVELSIFVRDRGEREDGELVPVNTTFVRHQGPGPITFEPESRQVDGEEWSESTTMATFSEPGSYLVRVRVDNFTTQDSSFDDQCCWSNAYIPVRVTE